MKEYKVENLELLNDKCKVFIGGERVYDWEGKFTQEEKLTFIDKYWTEKGEGMGTYMYNLTKKWNEEKENLPHDSWGYVKTVSQKAWLKRNDPKHIVDDHWHYGNYYFIGRDYSSPSFTVNSIWSGVLYSGQENKIVDQWFHDLLVKLEYEEEKWSKDHNPTVLKIRKIEEYYKLYGCFHSKKIGAYACNGESLLDYPEYEWQKTFHVSKPTEEDLDNAIKAYEEVDAYMEAKAKDFCEKFGWEQYED